jgi:thiamine-phosphate pyrophosphorylase
MYPTGTKSGAIYVGPERLIQLRPQARIPILAIGGIHAGNVAEVIRAGADGVAIIGAVMTAQDVAAAVSAILERIDRARGELG